MTRYNNYNSLASEGAAFTATNSRSLSPTASTLIFMADVETGDVPPKYSKPLKGYANTHPDRFTGPYWAGHTIMLVITEAVRLFTRLPGAQITGDSYPGFGIKDVYDLTGPWLAPCEANEFCGLI